MADETEPTKQPTNPDFSLLGSYKSLIAEFQRTADNRQNKAWEAAYVQLDRWLQNPDTSTLSPTPDQFGRFLIDWAFILERRAKSKNVWDEENSACLDNVNMILAAANRLQVKNLPQHPVQKVTRQLCAQFALAIADRCKDVSADPPEPAVVKGAKLTAGDLAHKYKLKPENLRKALESWRKKHDEGWVEDSNPHGRESRFMYSEEAVLSVIEKQKTLAAKHS